MSVIPLRGDDPSMPLAGKAKPKSPSILKYNPNCEFIPNKKANSVHFPISVQEPPLLLSRTSPPRVYDIPPGPVVFSSPPKSPSGEFYSTSVELQNSWCFWFDQYVGPGRPVEEYESALKLIGTFSTVQDFWRFYNNIPSPVSLPPRTSYHLMKQNSRPLWEDPENMYGGSFSFRIPLQLTEPLWLHVILNVIGEQLSDLLNADDGDDICGVTISRRRDENVIAIWHKYSDRLTPSFAEELVKIIKKNKAIFGFSPVLSYKVHQAEKNFKSDLSPVKPTLNKSSDETSPPLCN